jgi:hypothetical protein
VCYNRYINTKDSTQKCFQCGSPLILVNKTTTKIEGVRYPQTTTTYRCSNAACQAEKDKEAAKRIKLRDDKIESDRVRAEKKLEDSTKLKAEKELAMS